MQSCMKILREEPQKEQHLRSDGKKKEMSKERNQKRKIREIGVVLGMISMMSKQERLFRIVKYCRRVQ